MSPDTFWILAVVVGLLAFVLLRVFVLWYFRIDEIVLLLRQIRDRLPPPSA